MTPQTSTRLDLLTESYKNHYFATGLIYTANAETNIFDEFDFVEEPLNRLTGQTAAGA